jgi:hypothetical protein
MVTERKPTNARGEWSSVVAIIGSGIKTNNNVTTSNMK